MVRHSARTPVLLLAALAPLAFCLITNAWQADDAFITYRTVKNLWHGLGLTWNPGWRVQAYTHPLWMGVAALCYGITGECYYSVLVVAIGLSMALGVLFFVLAGADVGLGALAVLLLTTSSAVIQYSVSGLENPLLCLLLAGCARAIHRERPERAAWRSVLLAAAIALTRLDASLFVLPSLALQLRALAKRPRTALLSALGASPLVAWLGFSLVYYGSLVPNTALAKLNIDVPKPLLFLQGAYYFADSFQRDPVTLSLIGLALGLLAHTRKALARAHALGLALGLLYIFSIGGDFMTGRFFGAPCVFALAAVLCEGALPATRGRAWIPAGMALTVAYACVWSASPWRFDYQPIENGSMSENVAQTGIADERAFYVHSSGLINVLLDRDAIRRVNLTMPPHVWALQGRRYASSQRSLITVRTAIGFYGYFAGGKLVVDDCALADPFLARIPTCSRFRIGHCHRAIPEGYLESLRTGRNLLADRALARMYSRVEAVARGPLFTSERWQAILCLNLGNCTLTRSSNPYE